MKVKEAAEVEEKKVKEAEVEEKKKVVKEVRVERFDETLTVILD